MGWKSPEASRVHTTPPAAPKEVTTRFKHSLRKSVADRSDLESRPISSSRTSISCQESLDGSKLEFAESSTILPVYCLQIRHRVGSDRQLGTPSNQFLRT